MYQIDDFEGELRDVSTMDTDRLLDVRDQTAKAMANPSGYGDPSRWEHQLDLIDEELDVRGVIR